MRRALVRACTLAGMKRLITAALAAVLMLLGVPAAQAATTGPYAHLDINYNFTFTYVRYWVDDAHTSFSTIQVYPNHDSPRGATAIYVPANRRVYYKSIATQRYYWSVCAPVSNYAWEPIGNSVVILHTSDPDCIVRT